MRKSILAGAAAAASLIAGSASAATLVHFADFEEAPVNNGTYGIFASADGWTAGPGDAGIEVQDHAGAGLPAASGGQQFVELDSNSNSSMYYQLSSAGTYKIDFLYSPRPSVGPESNIISVYLNNTLLAPPGSLTGGPLGATDWHAYSTNYFQASAGDKLWFRAEGTSESLGGYVDNIGISAVPEPGAWALMITGFGLAGAALRRRRTTQAVA